MKLTKQTLKAINTKRIRPLIALALNRTEAWVIVLIRNNQENSMLTTAAALKVIKQETGLSEEEILTDSKQAIPQN